MFFNSLKFSFFLAAIIAFLLSAFHHFLVVEVLVEAVVEIERDGGRAPGAVAVAPISAVPVLAAVLAAAEHVPNVERDGAVAFQHVAACSKVHPIIGLAHPERLVVRRVIMACQLEIAYLLESEFCDDTP